MVLSGMNFARSDPCDAGVLRDVAILRLTGEVVLSQGEVPIEEVSRLVEHSDIGTTENVDRHELRPVLQNGARVMDGVLSSP
ncbi:hypothetical protein [Promicromonospora sp. MEB111]|uniref:hypothetical protein n=1 Tax=Promicromonospora sp. MEB111 TaxID=3040301 RepID=UPI00254E170A|nr:hypothetical protein [Promicromonospora sp. MEB111]